MPAAGETVTFACKHPAGLILRVFDRDEYDVPVLGGGTRKESRAVAIGEPIKINGPATSPGVAPAFVIAGGYALTPNIPADFANKWMADNKASPLVKNNIVFIQKTEASATSKAKEQKAVRSGLERLDPGVVFKNGRPIPKDPRWPARTNPNLSTVETDQREDAA